MDASYFGDPESIHEFSGVNTLHTGGGVPRVYSLRLILMVC